jgi:hypothetical protein
VPVGGPAAWANAPRASAKLSAETTKTALFKVTIFKVTIFNNDIVLSLNVSVMVNNDTMPCLQLYKKAGCAVVGTKRCLVVRFVYVSNLLCPVRDSKDKAGLCI